ncbi:MAG: alkaline phosphatase family protein [Pelolinea sp.]|nr:alkaline phosphatase family protein [Pelolinea sp.]
MSNKSNIKFIWLVILILLTACQPAWTLQLKSDRLTTSFSQKEFQELKKEYSVTEDCSGLPFNIVLYKSGFEVIDSITFKNSAGEDEKINWQEKGEEGCLNTSGQVNFGSQKIASKVLTIKETPFGSDVTRILDIAPTVLSALGIKQEDLPGKKIVEGSFDHVVLIFLDGFGYSIYEKALQDNLLENLPKASLTKKALTVFPPRTSIISAAILTGLPPYENGVYETGLRKTEATTIFDLISNAGLKSIAVEGESLSFNLRNTEVILSGDKDSNGSTDDNVFSNVNAVIKSHMLDLLWIHFHGIDDLGHTFGPGSQRVDDKIVEIDAYVGKIMDSLPENTLIIAFADHGMHSVTEEGRLGNHGNLIYDDMVIPIFFETK